MRSRLIPLLSVLAVAALCAPADAQEKKQGVYAGLEALATSRRLLLKDGSKYEISSTVWSKYRGKLQQLRKGDAFEFYHRGTQLVSVILAGDEDTTSSDPDQLIRSTGRFVRQRVEGSRVWLVLQSGREEVLSPRLFKDRSQAQVLIGLTRGDPVIFWTKGGFVVQVRKGTLNTSSVDAAVAKVLRKSRRLDQVHVQLKTENSPKFYRIHQIMSNRLILMPHVPGTEDPPKFQGKVTFDLREIALVLNKAARERGEEGDNGGDDPENPTNAAWEDIKVGDMIGIGFKRGQLIGLTPTHYEWRVWSRGFWGEPEKGERASVQKIRRGIELPKQESVPLEGGRLELRVNRARTSQRGGLRFKVELVHNVKPVILVDLKVRFLLGSMAMGPDDPVQASESVTISVPMFANQRESVIHEIADDKFMDGRVEVAVYPKNIVPIKSKEARKYILKSISRTKNNDQLESIYVAAGTNGDRKVCKLLLTNYILENDPEHRRTILKGLQAFEELAPTLILEQLVGLDRHLEVAKLIGEQIIDTPLPQQVRPVTFKRRMIDLLVDLPGALRGRFGQKLFDIHNERDNLQDRIKQAFVARPHDAVTSLLGIATQVDTSAVDDNEGRKRAEDAAKLLRSLGKPILPALYTELKKQEIDPGPCKDLFEKTGSASDAIKLGQDLLIQQYLRLQEEEWERQIDMAQAKATGADKDWDGALAIVRGVLAKKKTHERAKELLPTLLVNKAIDHREEGNRGGAAVAFEEALPLLNPAERPKAAGPLAELIVQAASEDVEKVCLRTHPHAAAGLVRPANMGEAFEGKEAEANNDWIEIKLGEGLAYVLKDAMRVSGPNQYAVSSAVTPFKAVNDQLKKARELAPSLKAQADEVYGHLSAREGKAKYEANDFQAALAHFDEAAKYAPTDPRLSLKFKTMLKANTGPLVGAALVIVFALGVAIMQAFSKPKKVAFKGEFKHYGSDRSQRERDLDIPDGGEE